MNGSRRGRNVGAVVVVASLGAAVALLTGGSAVADATTTTACPSFNPPNTLTLAGGTPQSAKLGAPFDTSLQVTLANSNGCPITTPLAGIAVTFAAPASGPSGTFSASGSNAVLVGTSAQGGATASQFTANGLAGGYQVVASSQYGSVSFSLVNTASGVPATIAAVLSNQSATAGSRYTEPLQAKVLDADGDPVGGASVSFTLGSSTAGGAGAGTAGASFDAGGNQATEVTNAAGIATSPLLTANTVAGTFTASAATAGVVEPAAFALDNLAGKPTKLEGLAPAGQSATAGACYRKPLSVKVLGGDGKPLQGATVTFTLGTGGGNAGASGAGSGSAGASFVDGSSQATATTDAAGIATSPRLVANTTAGKFTATATTIGTDDAVSFPLDNLAGKAPSVTTKENAKQSAAVGTRYARPLQVRVRAGGGKPLQGASVTFTLGTGGGSSAGSTGAAGASFVGGSAQATETTNAAGIATSPRFAANTTAGTFTATATVAGTTRAASFVLRNASGKAATIAAGVAATASTATGTRFPVRLAVTVTDSDGNPVAGVTVSFSAPTHGPSGRFDDAGRTVEVKTDAKGVAIAPPFVANRMQGGYVVRASAAGHSAAFALVNQPAG